MNYSAMTDMEMLHYLDMYSDDPIIRRLANVLLNTRGTLINELENAGMDPKTWQFETDWQSMYPGDYIIHLRRELENTESDLDSAQRELESLQEKYNQVKTRTIMDFVEEVQREKRANQDLVREAMATVQAYKKENEKLSEQIDMWGKMNRVKQEV